MVSEDPSDLLALLWLEDLVSPQDDGDVPDRGKKGRGEPVGSHRHLPTPSAKRWGELLQNSPSDGEEEEDEAAVCSTHPDKQCAAVITQSEATRTPPQAEHPTFRYAM